MLARFTSAQKTQLQAILTRKELKRGDVVWRKGEPVAVGCLISNGGARFVEVSGELDASQPPPDEDSVTLAPGAFIFDMVGTMTEQPLTTTLVVETATATVLVADTEPLMRFLESNPLLLLALLKSQVIF